MSIKFDVNIFELFAAHRIGSPCTVRTENKRERYIHLVHGRATNIVNMRTKRIELLDKQSVPEAMIPREDLEQALCDGFTGLAERGEEFYTSLLESWSGSHTLVWKTDKVIYAESTRGPCDHCAYLGNGQQNAPGEGPFCSETYTNHYICTHCGQRWERYTPTAGHWNAVEAFVGPSRPMIVSNM